jgi:DNA-binding IclR family transcriptional regulator
LGLRFKLHNNAPGKLLLAFLATERQQEVLDQIELDATTKRTITKKPLLKTECERIVKQGYSTDYAEADDGIHCIAAPIFGIDREVVGAIWVSGPAKRLPKSRFRELGTKTIAAGNRITYLIGDSA